MKERPLDLVSDWDHVVNPVTRKRRAYVEDKLRKWLQAVTVLLAVVLLALVIWLASGASSGIAVLVASCCGCAASFLAGRIYEVWQR